MSYSKNTLLRYFPAESTEHYTGVVLANGILQVKPKYKQFPSLSEWLATLPGQPTKDKLEVNEKTVTPPLIWKKNQRSLRYYNLTWPAYLYTVITRSNRALKKNTELCEAFNRLVDVLDGMPNIYVLVSPIRRGKAYEHVLFTEPQPNYPQEKWDRLPVQYCRVDKDRVTYMRSSSESYRIYVPQYDSLEERKTFVAAIYEAYQALYDLMEKHGVIRYVREVNEMAELRYLKRRLHKETNILSRLQYKKERIETETKNQRSRVDQLRQKIDELNKQ